jgi:hypothetical protein
MKESSERGAMATESGPIYYARMLASVHRGATEQQGRAEKKKKKKGGTN